MRTEARSVPPRTATDVKARSQRTARARRAAGTVMLHQVVVVAVACGPLAVACGGMALLAAASEARTHGTQLDAIKVNAWPSSEAQSAVASALRAVGGWYGAQVAHAVPRHNRTLTMTLPRQPS